MKKKYWIMLAAAVIAGAGYFVYARYQDYLHKLDEAFASGNGRLEATEIGIDAKMAGRIEKILADEGDYVSQGQLIAVMQTNTLEAQMAQAEAKLQQAVTAEKSARTMIRLRIEEKSAAEAIVEQQHSNLAGAQKRFDRTRTLVDVNAASKQSFDDDETALLKAKAALAEAGTKVKQAEAMIEVAKAEAEGAKANIAAAKADIAKLKADLDDCKLVSPRDGRVQYRVAQPGEVLSAGGRVLNVIDLTDVYMTFFLPEKVAGKVRYGADVRLLLDASPDTPVPARVVFVDSVAQFTPKTVETKSEREKLMFRVKARIPQDLLKKHIQMVKTGVPGVAWVKIDPGAEWPDELKLKSEK